MSLRFLAYVPRDAVNAQRRRVELVEIAPAVHTLPGIGREVEGEFVEEGACHGVQGVSQGIVAPAGQVHVHVRQHPAQRVRCYAAAGHLPLYLLRHLVQFVEHAVQALVGMEAQREVAGHGGGMHAAVVHPGLQSQVEGVVCRVVCGQLHAVYAALYAVVILQVRAAVERQHHGGGERVFGQAQGMEVDLVQRQREVGHRVLAAYVHSCAGIGLQQFVLAEQVYAGTSLFQQQGHAGVVHGPVLVLQFVQRHTATQPCGTRIDVGAVSAQFRRERNASYAVLRHEVGHVDVVDCQVGGV